MSFDTPARKPTSRDFRVQSAVAAAAIVIIVAAGIIALHPQQAASSLVGGPFALQTGDGKTITEASLKGHPFLIYFGYTHCPDVCPTDLAQISNILAKLPGKPITALFVTVDPERDTPKAMADYVSSFDPRILGLSGDPQAIGAVEKAYRVYSRKGPTEKNGDYAMDHTSVVYLMDAEGRFVEAFNLDRSADDAAKELASYL